MNIRRRFHFNAWVLICLMLGILAVFYAYKVKLEIILESENKAEQLMKEFIIISITTEGYIHHDDAEHAKDWLGQITTMRNLVDEQTPYQTEINRTVVTLENMVLECKISQESDWDICKEEVQDQLLFISDLLHENYILTKENSRRMLNLYKNIVIGYILVAIVATIILSRENIRKVLHPLDELLDGVKAVQRGHYNYRVPIDQNFTAISSNDELGQLAIAFNLMSTDLEYTFANLQKELETNIEIMDQLSKSERNLNRAEEIAHVGSWVLDAETDILICSKETFRIWGLSPDQKSISLEEVLSLIHPEDKEKHRELFNKMEVEKIPYPMQFRIMRPDHSIRYVYQTTAIELDEDGDILRAYGAMLDITEQHEIMMELREREQLLQQVMDTNPNMIYLFDEEGRLVMVNQELANRYGVHPRELIGKNDFDLAQMGLLSLENAQRFYDNDREVIRTQKTKFIPIEESFDNKGNPIWTQTTLTPLNRTGMDPMGLGVSVDITKQQKVLMALEEREQLLQQVIDENPNIIYLFDGEDRMIMVNQRYAECFGRTVGELAGKTNHELCAMGIIDQATADRFCHHNTSVIQSQEPLHIPEENVLLPNGNRFWVQSSLTPLNRPGEQPMGLGVSVDITERKEIEEEIRSINTSLEARVAERTQELAQANEELRSFAYSISHDLRSPLRAIDGFSRILIQEKPEDLTPKAVRYINLLRENAVMMGKLIEGLLEFSRKGRQALNFQTVHPSELINQILLDMSYEYPDHPAEIMVGELPECTADSLLLKQVYQNLISNAFKFTSKSEKPVIEIGSKIKDNEVIYFVKDNGVGFNMKYTDRLFGVFQRLHRIDEFQGTGVGLAIVQRIIHRHGGEIWAEAATNEGAAFYFTLSTAKPNKESPLWSTPTS